MVRTGMIRAERIQLFAKSLVADGISEQDTFDHVENFFLQELFVHVCIDYKLSRSRKPLSSTTRPESLTYYADVLLDSDGGQISTSSPSFQPYGRASKCKISSI